MLRSSRLLRLERRRRLNAEAERDRLLLRVEEATARVRSLQGLLAMCSWCKSIRDGSGEWKPLEAYLEQHLEAAFTHAVCPECLRVEYPGLFEQE